MSKYYICNDIMFLGGNSKMVISPSSGVHMKISKAKSFISIHPKYEYYRARNSAKGTNYVICTPMKFYGNDSNIVNDIKKAKAFDSVDDAYRAIDTAIDLDKELRFVIDENFSRKKAAEVKTDDVDPLELFTYANMDSTERIIIPPHIKNEIYKQSNGICPICGKALSKYAYTIDHIVPLSRGGTNHPNNLRAVHDECNKLKGKFSDKELYKNAVSVVCNGVHSNPNSGATAMLLRSLVRGIILANTANNV